MNRRSIKAAAAVGTLVAFAAALAPSAKALEVYKTYSEGCARWESQGAGQRIKCFDCLKRQRIKGRRVWVNTCAQ